MFFFKKRRSEARAPETLPEIGSPAEAVWEPPEVQPDGSVPQPYFSGYVSSDLGCLRGNNEDNYLLDAHMNRESGDTDAAEAPRRGGWNCAGVFDGMGGGELGELASRLAAEAFLEAAERFCPDYLGCDADRLMRQAFRKANLDIVTLQQQSNVYGTTGTVLCSNGVYFKLYHLGDSRAYLLRGGELRQLTRDQTLAQAMIDTGIYGPDAPQADTDRHILTDYIGHDPTGRNIRPEESVWHPILPGDRVLLCSDGLYDMCSDSRIRSLLQNGSAREQASRLIQAARQAGGHDNITCMILSLT